MARLERSDVFFSFIPFCVFAGLILLALVFTIWNHKPWLGRVRFFTIIPFAIGGAMATYHFNDIRSFPFQHQYRFQAATLRTVYGLSSITMDLAAAWAIVVLVWLLGLDKTSGLTPERTTVARRKHSSDYFYLAIIDLAIFGCLLASAVIAGTFVPFAVEQCSKYENNLMIALFAKATGEHNTSDACYKAFWIQCMTGISATITLLQIILEVPYINLPNGLRFAIFFAIRLIRRPHSAQQDLEIGGTDTVLEISDREDLEVELAELVKKHPHCTELIAAIKRSNFATSLENLELLARISCAGKTKSQCWACEGVICDECTISRSDVPSPQTNHHITHCLAVCTTCYLLIASSEPAALSATLNPADLSRQHRGCRFEEKKRTLAGEIFLCRPCGNQASGDIAGIREAREAKRLALTLKRDILCGECEKPIPKQKRRWWICGAGNHDCHWGGHEVLR